MSKSLLLFMLMLLDVLENVLFSSNPSDHLPVIITGDFNLQPDSAVYELMVRGQIQYDKLSDKTLQRFGPMGTGRVAGKVLVPPHLEITGEVFCTLTATRTVVLFVNEV